MEQKWNEIPPEEISNCLTTLHITTHEAFLLSAYSQNQPLYTAKAYIFQAIQNYLLTKDVVIVNRIRKLFPEKLSSFYTYYENEITGWDLADILFPEAYSSELGKKGTVIDCLKLEELFQKNTVYPFQNLIESPPNKETILSVYRNKIKPESITYTDLNILLIFMVFDSCFSAISESVYSYKDNRTSLIKNIISYLGLYEIDFHHSNWILDKIEAGESFDKINKNHMFFSDEYSFFKKLFHALSQKDNVDYYGVFLFILSEANKGSKFLDALYNNYHSRPPCSLSPYLYGRLFPSFRMNPETWGPNYLDKNALPASFIMNELYPQIVNSWKKSIQKYFGFINEWSTNKLISFLVNISKIEFVHNYLSAIHLIENVQLVASKMENDDGELNAKKYYYYIKTQVVMEQITEKQSSLREEVKELIKREEWEKRTQFDKYPYEKNPFVDFTIDRRWKNCFLHFFKRNVNEIESIVNGYLAHISVNNNKEDTEEDLSLDLKSFNALFGSNLYILEEIMDLFVWEQKNNQFLISKEAIENNNISVVYRKSPIEWEEFFNLFCNISFGKKPLSKEVAGLQNFVCECDGSVQSFCRKRFMNIIENNNPISKTKISFKGLEEMNPEHP